MKEIKKDNEKKKTNIIKKNKNNNSYWEKYKCKKGNKKYVKNDT